MNTILEVLDLNVFYKQQTKFIFEKKITKQILKNITFSIGQGEVLGLVGESGCGKSTLAKAILGMVKNVDGTIIHYSDRPQMIFQDPYGSLNPVKTVGWILQEPLRNSGMKNKSLMRKKAIEMLQKVGLEEKYMEHFSHQLSGGQRQRVCIAAALMLEPKLLIADEPLSALDVTIQLQMVTLLLRLQREMGLAILFISHDLRIVYQMCDHVMIMKHGEIVEEGEVDKVYFSPQHSYTKTLLDSAGIQNRVK